MAPNRITRPGTRLAMCVAALVVSALSATTTAPAAPTRPASAPTETDADASPGVGAVVGLNQNSTDRVPVFIELDAVGAASVAAVEPRLSDEQVASIEGMQRSVVDEARRLHSDATELYTLTNLMPGVAMIMEEGKATELAKLGNVKKVWRIHPMQRANASTAQLVNALNTWKYQGYTGKGVKIGILDSGLDYTHAMFGGVGTAQAYQEAEAKKTQDGWRDSLPELAKAKIGGGYDFVGDEYTGENQPHPDSNPLDCRLGHGTHVGGIAGGYGVTADGKPFTGDYSTLTAQDTSKMLIGPGMAPQAQLYGLRLFGCVGGTTMAAKAIDWAMDPNGDGNFDDRLDIINMSFGDPFGAPDRFETPLINEATKLGTLFVTAGGNSSDVVDAAGPPATAPATLTVANSRDASQTFDGMIVHGPDAVAGRAHGQASKAFNWDAANPLRGRVVALSDETNLDGCKPFNAADAAAVNGKIVWLEWDSNHFNRACGSSARALNATNAGAVGAIYTNNLLGFNAAVAASPTVPVLQLTTPESDRLRSAARAGTLEVTFDPALRSAVHTTDPAIADTMSLSSSRGTHGSGGVSKPDVTAPGETIISAGAGTGNQPMSWGGTSMATPAVAGVVALLKQARPGWSALQLKAAVMNGAVHDVFTGLNKTGHRYGPLRTGAGRIDATRTLGNGVLMYADVPDNAVSASFGVVDVPADQKEVRITQNILLENTTDTARRLTVSTDLATSQGGVRFEVPQGRVFVRPRGFASFPVTMVVDASQLRRAIDPTMDVKQGGRFRQYVADTSGRLVATGPGVAPIRIPLFAAARPVSKTIAAVRGAELRVNGAGFNMGNAGQGWESLMTAVELGGESPELPVCQDAVTQQCTANDWDRAADLKAWGAAANDRHTWFAIATHANWSNPGNMITPTVEIDTNDDGEPDVRIVNRMRWASNMYEATATNLATNESRTMAANFREGDKDTGVFDNNIAIVPVANDFLGVSAGTSSPIKYRVTIAEYDSEVSPWTEFNPGTTKFTMTEPLVADRAGTSIAINPKGDFTLMALHLHGDANHKIDLIKVGQ